VSEEIQDTRTRNMLKTGGLRNQFTLCRSSKLKATPEYKSGSHILGFNVDPSNRWTSVVPMDDFSPDGS